MRVYDALMPKIHPHYFREEPNSELAMKFGDALLDESTIAEFS
jgi:hypothetical protein